MAIEVTTFNYPTVPSSNIDEVYDWLVANASEYFPGGIVKDTPHQQILCFSFERDEPGMAAIPFSGNNSGEAGYIRTKYSTGAETVQPNGPNTNRNGYNKAVKTSCGFALCANWNGGTWFFSKTNTGTVCTFAVSSYSWNSNQYCMVFADLGGDINAIKRGGHASIYELHSAFRLANGMGITAMVPVCFNCGSYAGNLLYTPFTQTTFDGGLQTVLVDGQEYVYDGLIALKS